MQNEELINSLIAEVAKRHKVLLSPDDPILVTVTLHELLVDRNIDQMNGVVDSLLLKLEDRIVIQQAKNTQNAEHIINSSLVAAQETIELCATAASKETQAANEVMIATIKQLNREAKLSQGISLVCCGLTGIMLFGAVLWAM